MKHLVYKTTNLVNGKYYIGVHSCSCKDCKYLGSGKALKAALTKYGRENFSREILQEFNTREEAFAYEAEVVVINSKSYNLIAGGAGKPECVPCPELVKLKISNSLKGYRHTLKTKAKMSKSTSGVLHPNYGKVLSVETRQKISVANKGRVLTLASRLSRSKSCVIQGITFNSQSEAKAYFQVSHGTITNWIRNPKKPDCFRT